VTSRDGAEERETTLASREQELAAAQADMRIREDEVSDRETRVSGREDAVLVREQRADDTDAFSWPPAGELEIGSVLDGRWRIDAFVARGGVGTVWRATDLKLGRVVAVKLMRSDLLDDGLALDRFRREAELLARVEHEHVMRLFDVAEIGGQLCLVSEFVGGMSLRQLMARHAPFSAEVVASVGSQLATGVAAIHAQGVVHRDLKPRNVMLTERGLAKIVDFGTARRLTAELTPSPAGQVGGSPAYLAPEQVEGRSGDQRTDLYSLGLILWEAAVGRRPFAGDTSTATALARLTAEVPSVREERGENEVSELLDEVILRLTRQDPKQRYRSAWEVVDSLAPITPARPIDLIEAVLGDE
jgi:serine/threonine-protein kinase